MKMMHYYKDVSKIEIPYVEVSIENPVENLIKLMLSIKEWLDTTPKIYMNRNEGDEIYISFPEIAYTTEDFWYDFGEELISLGKEFIFEIYSYPVSSTDSIFMEIEREGDKYYYNYKSVSGKMIDMVKSLNFGIKVKERNAKEIYTLLNCMNWDEKVLILSGDKEILLKKYNLPTFEDGSFYSYGWFSEKINYEAFQNSLNMERKIELWKSFLVYRVDYVEFSWVLNSLCENTLTDRSEWELSMYQSLQELNYRVIISEGKFELRDDKDNPVYFSYNDDKFSYKCFLKMLFPIRL